VAALRVQKYHAKMATSNHSIAQPLTAKTHKYVVKNKFIWTDFDQKAFDFLRTCLITPPLLVYPDFNLEFLLFTDACDCGIGSFCTNARWCRKTNCLC
jgi:hypothetical protein